MSLPTAPGETPSAPAIPTDASPTLPITTDTVLGGASSAPSAPAAPSGLNPGLNSTGSDGGSNSTDPNGAASFRAAGSVGFAIAGVLAGAGLAL